MSDEKIDHAAEAADMVKHAATSDDEMERRLTGQAQVHATLALVEQQRIANLIALAKFTVVPGNMPTFRHVVFDKETGEDISPEIRKGLGL